MIISKAPVRLSMGGGGTDLASYYEKRGGFLISTAINRYIYILLNKRFYKSIRLSYSETEIVDDIKEVKHNIFREALKYTGITKQIEILSVADVPANCGLGTSSAFTVALLNGLYNYKKEYICIERIAEEACEIEINVLKAPIGKQDQYASAFGGFNAYIFNKDGSVRIEPVKIREELVMELQNNLFLFHLKSERSASSVLSTQNNNCKTGDEDTISRLDKIKEIGLYTRKVLEEGNIDEFGDLLHQHWLTKKKLSNKISNPYIDEVYETARKNGAIGGKVVGAGGGGFLLLYCPCNKSRMVETLRKLGLSPMWFSFEPDGVSASNIR